MACWAAATGSGRLAPGERVTERGSTLQHEPGWQLKMLINGFGAICTAGVALVFAVTKFRDGAWVVLILIPLMVGSGLVYMFYRYPQRYSVVSLKVGGLEWVAIAHTVGAFLMLAFVITHLYLITTGQTLTSNLKAMITGYEELPDGHEDEPAPSA